jgi:predicted nuclease with TOPRIM domain
MLDSKKNIVRKAKTPITQGVWHGICPKCGKQFKDGRALWGHLKLGHGIKTGQMLIELYEERRGETEALMELIKKLYELNSKMEPILEKLFNDFPSLVKLSEKMANDFSLLQKVWFEKPTESKSGPC